MPVSLLQPQTLTPLLVGLFTGILSLLLWYIFINQYLLYGDVDSYPMKNISDIDSEEPVVIRGTVTGNSQTHESPFATEDSVFTSWEINQTPQRGNASRGRCLYRGIQSTPFTIEDDTGTLAVDFDSISQPPNPRGIENVLLDSGIRVSNTVAGIGEQQQVVQKAASNEPEHISQFIDQFDDFEMFETDGESQHQCNEQTLTSGSDIIIVGQIKYDADDTPYITQMDDTESIVYAGSYENLLFSLRRNYIVPLTIAIITSVVTLYMAWLVEMAI